MIDRRSALRSLSLAALAVGTAPILTACGDGEPRASADGTDARMELARSSAGRATGDVAAIPSAVASTHALGAHLYERLLVPDENLALSPYSIAVALAMTLNGAAGATRDEMLDVLGASSVEELNHGVNALTLEIGSLARRKVVLRTANQLFGQRGVEWEGAFLDALAREYGAGLRTLDFARASEAARRVVNRWTARRTSGRIREILPSGSVDPLTRLVLVNALYLKAAWLEPFEKTATDRGDFHLPDGGTVEVPMMHASCEEAAAAIGDGWTSVRLPYVGGRLAMTIVLPDRGRDVDVAELPDIVAAARPAGVELTLPRWTFRTEIALRDALAALGMPTAFDEARADFSAMTEDDEQLVVDDVYHQVFVAVDEAGTEAAAATAVAVRATSAMLAEHRVVVDRPFLFVIHDVQHGTPLFLGRVADPRG